MSWNNIKAKLVSVDDIFTNIVIVILIAVLSWTIYSKVNGNEIFIFGYRPVFALTGSMEPEIMTHSIIMTKRVDNPSEVKEDDIVSFYVQQNGEMVNVTHRIRKIEDGYIITKGDNNESEDLYPVPVEEVHSKVVSVWNGFADIYNFFTYIFNHKMYSLICFLKFLGFSLLIGTGFAGIGFAGIKVFKKLRAER